MTDPLIDPEGRCERCGRLVPLECPEPDGIGCGSYVLEVTAEEGVDTAALVERLRATCPPDPPPGARPILWQDPATGPGQAGVIIARRITGDGEIRGPALVVTHDLDVPPECNGAASARWCPTHGECTCLRDEEGAFVVRRVGFVIGTEVQHEPSCPLHGPTSTHCEALPPGIVWRSTGKCPCRDGLQESADGGLELCEDCDGTGWASESNPGTGGGTGRDEQIAVPCPRGCPEPLPMYDDPARDDDGPSWGERVRSQLEAMANGYDPTQAPTSPAHASLGPDGRITTVYPSGESYTDPTPRLEPATLDITEEAFFEAAFFESMDDIVERVTGTRPGARGCEADDQGPEAIDSVLATGLEAAEGSK